MYDMLKIIMEDNILFRNCKSEEKVDILVRNEYMPSPCARTHAPTHCPPHLPPTPIHTPMTTRPPPFLTPPQDAFEPVEYKRGDFVINQGEDGQHFFAVWSGSLKAYIKKDGADLHVASYGQGKSFGELALMYNTPRAASVKAEDDCVLLR